MKALASKAAAGPKARLSAERKAAVMKVILEGPKAHRHPTEVGTLPRVAKLIEEQTGERYHTLGTYGGSYVRWV